MTDLDVPDGFALACQVCGWRPGEDLAAGLLRAHFETEPGHDPDRIRLDLLVLCPRCDQGMECEMSRGNIDVFYCATCRRRRSVRRESV